MGCLQVKCAGRFRPVPPVRGPSAAALEIDGLAGKDGEALVPEQDGGTGIAADREELVVIRERLPDRYVAEYLAGHVYPRHRLIALPGHALQGDRGRYSLRH